MPPARPPFPPTSPFRPPPGDAAPEETRVTASLPGLDLEMRLSQDPGGRSETVTLSLRATPGFEAAAGLLAGPALPLALLGAARGGRGGAADPGAESPWAANPWTINPWAAPWLACWDAWARMAALAWRPWIDAGRRD